jgi:hypothetical protein
VIINIVADGLSRDPAPAAPDFPAAAAQGAAGADAECGFFDDYCAQRGGSGGQGAPGTDGGPGQYF